MYAVSGVNIRVVARRIGFMRLFVAVNFNWNTRTKLLALRDEVRKRSVRGSFVSPENLHLTLAFLDECSREQVVAAKKAMDKVIFDPFDIFIDSLGRFKRDGSDLWWAGVSESKELLKLQSNLTDNLISAGFVLDKKNYKPHITLGRKVVSRLAPRHVEPFGQTISKIDLMQSETIKGDLKYTPIYQVP